jgi:hypothetical protein
MRIAVLLLCAMVLGAGLLLPATLTTGQSVYLLPMSAGLDQHLANRISESGLFQVVTDLKKAGAVFTDKLGEPFEERLNALFPQPAGGANASLRPGSSFSRSKGTIFLVDIATRQVLWSAYENPKNTSPGELDRIARRIVDGLKNAAKAPPAQRLKNTTSSPKPTQ